MSKVDLYYRKLVLSKFFTHGWGDSKILNKIVDYRRNYVGKRDTCLNLLDYDYKVHIDEEFKFKDHTVLNGHFESPLVNYIPDLMPEEIRSCKFQMLIPTAWNKSFSFNGTNTKPVCFHLAGTGDHFFWRRRLLIAKPLLTEYSVGSIIIENPFYGLRKPKQQVRSSLRHVSDLYMMGFGLITESAILMKWCEKNGLGPFALTGISMGGHMACLASTVWPKPLALIPCLAWTTASTVFTRGVMSSAIPWDLLEKQFKTDKHYQILKEKIEENNLLLDRRAIPMANAEFEIQNTGNSIYYLSHMNKTANLINYNPQPKIDTKILDFMQLLMDECTHIINYDKPIDMNLIKVVAALEDAYILRDGVHDFHSVWPGCQVEYIDRGHISAFLFSQKKYRETIKHMLDILVNKYYR